MIAISAFAAGGGITVSPVGGGSEPAPRTTQAAQTAIAAAPQESSTSVRSAAPSAHDAEAVRLVALAEPAPTGASADAPSPILAEGPTVLRAGIEAIRHGDTVVVTFDHPSARTRRADKFEQLLRSTLPAIYGAFADTVLAAHGARLVSDPQALVGVLPSQGIALAARGGWRIMVWPETRPGRDGPLVIRYRTTPSR